MPKPSVKGNLKSVQSQPPRVAFGSISSRSEFLFKLRRLVDSADTVLDRQLKVDLEALLIKHTF